MCLLLGIMLEINTLSNPEVVLGNDKVVKFVSRKALALVVYLAITPGNRSREELADLLWSDQSQEQATRNLRVVLSDIRKKIGDYLFIDRNSVAIHKNMDIRVDVHQLKEAIETENLDAAISLYKGDFLESFYLRGASRFENWQVFEREKIKLELIDGLTETTHLLFKAGKSKESIKYLIYLTKLEPLLESAHRQLMQAYFDNGDTTLALKQFEICKQALAEELSVTPAEETLNLYAHFAQQQGSRTLESVILHNLPNFSTPFIGQIEKSLKLIDLISNPEVRHLSLVGPGGYGKSRLAIHLSKKCLTQFPDGVFWIPLQGFEKDFELSSAIADAIGFIHQAENSLKDELLNHLGTRQMLLVLDNFEHLLASASLVSEILKATQYVKIITTSRQNLNLKGETIFLVHGMNFPVAHKSNLDKALGEKYDAIQLFVKSALRSSPSFLPKDKDLETIASICRYVDGMPLAIEMAAGWVTVLSPIEIEGEIDKGFDFLEVRLRDVEERHRSLHVVAGQSWGMLTEGEKAVFKRLSIVKGPFTRRAAQRITGAKINDLLSLSNKSFLQKDNEGLLRVHEWLRQFGEGELRKSKVDLSESLELFSNYYVNYLSGNWWEAWSGECQNLRLEWRNITEAMLIAARAGKVQFLGKGLLPYFFVSYVGDDFSKSATLFSQMAAEFENRELVGDERLTFALCLVFCAYFLRTQCRHGMHDQAEKTYDKAENLLQGCDQGWEYAWVKIIECLDECYTDSENFFQYAERALKIFTKLDDDYALAFTYNILACGYHGDKKRALCQSALGHARKHNGTRDIACALLELGRGEIEKGDLDLAAKYTTDALSRYTNIHSSEGMIISNEYMGIISHCQRKYSQAKQYYEDAFKLCDRVGWKSRIEIYKLLIGSVMIAMKDYDLGQQFILEATTSWIERDGEKMHVWVSPPEVSFLLDYLGNPELAVILLIKSLEFPGPEFKPQLEKLFQELETRYTKEEMSEWIKKAKDMKPVELATATRDALLEH